MINYRVLGSGFRVQRTEVRSQKNLSSVFCFLFLVFCFLSPVPCPLSPAYAESAIIEELPPMPQNTVLFKQEEIFGQRGKVGGFCVTPSQYRLFYDEQVY